MKGININARITVRLAYDAEEFYREYCMKKYGIPHVHVRNNDGSLTMQLHEAMSFSAAYPHIGRSPFDKGMICFDESNVIEC